MQPEPSRQVLESTPARVLTFLRAIGTNTEIRSTLAAVGYTAGEHQLAWSLLHKASGYAEPPPPSGDDSVRRAIAELTAWDEPGFRRIRAALARLHPAQASFVFEALAPAEGAASILAVRKLLDRLSALEAGEGPGSPAENHAAVATLEKRGITKAERERLAGLLALAEKAPSPSRRPRPTAASTTSRPCAPGTPTGPRPPAPSSPAATT